MGNKKKTDEVKRKISKAEKQIAYYHDMNKYFVVPRPKGLDTIKAEELIPDLKAQLTTLQNDES